MRAFRTTTLLMAGALDVLTARPGAGRRSGERADRRRSRDPDLHCRKPRFMGEGMTIRR